MPPGIFKREAADEGKLPMLEHNITDFRVAEAVRFIESNFNQDLDFTDLAATLHLSVSRLRYLFKEETGVSFRKYLRRVRMNGARQVLETSFLSVKETGSESASAMPVSLSKILKKNSEFLPQDIESSIARLKKTNCLNINPNKTRNSCFD